MKDTQSEIKQNIQGTNSDRKETMTQINDLEQKGEINIQQLEQNKESRIQKNEERLRKCWDNYKCSNIQMIGVPEGEDPQSGKGNRLLAYPGSSESHKNVRPNEEHTKTHHN